MEALLMDFNVLKQQSKKLIRETKPSPVSVGLIYVAIIMLLTSLTNQVATAKITESDITNLQTMMMDGRYDYAMTLYEKMLPTKTASAIELAISIVSMIIEAGFIIYLLNVARKTGTACYGNLLDGFGMFFRVIFLDFFIGLFVALWSLLLIFPGIIAAYRYSQAKYILLDNPDKGIFQCIRESKEMMKGRKWERFTLGLSFIGWYFLSIVPFVRIWTEPYIGLTKVLYYDRLCRRTDFESTAEFYI